MGRIGILGGTFDPIHYGHLFIAENARAALALDRVLLIPTGIPPHKAAGGITAKEHRFRMCALAAAGNPYFEACSVETDSEEVSYTVATMEKLKAQSPGDTFFFIVGSDSLFQMETWRDFPRLCSMIEIVCAPRLGEDFAALQQAVFQMKGRCEAPIHLLRTPLMEISSTELRRRAALGLPIRYMLPESVERYIAEHKLYSEE